MLFLRAGTNLSTLIACRLCTNASPGAEVVGLQEFTEYEVRIQASNSKGCSEWSKPLRVLTRRRAVEGGCDCGLYKWTQTRSEVVIHVAVRPIAAPQSRHLLNSSVHHHNFSQEESSGKQLRLWAVHIVLAPLSSDRACCSEASDTAMLDAVTQRQTCLHLCACLQGLT